MKTAVGVLLTGLLWAVIWGTLGYVVVLASAFFNPDFGHMGPQLTSLVMAGVGLLSGTIAGSVFALMAWARSMSNRRARVLLGAACGAAVGVVPSISARHWYLQLVAITIPLGALRHCVLPRRAAPRLYRSNAMDQSSPQFAQLKSALKATWMAGDFGEIAKHTAKEGEEFINRIGIRPGARVLDVACGTGNTAIPAAHLGAEVVGVDIATNSLEQAAKRAKAANLRARFQEGDAEQLPFGDAEFDYVVTMYGAMFAPRPDRVASELLRVCKPGGTIAMANWTPEGFVGKTFRTMSEHVPPPPGIPAPILWGREDVVRERLGKGAEKIRTERRPARFDYPFPPEEVVGFFRQYFGPTQVAFSRLDAQGQEKLTKALTALWREHNQSPNGRTLVEAEYLEVHALRA